MTVEDVKKRIRLGEDSQHQLQSARSVFADEMPTDFSIDLFSDRLEITSPDALPNSVTSDNIQYGIHLERNPVLLSTMEKIPSFSYSGRGIGIPRVIRLCKDRGLTSAFLNDTDAARFIVTVSRPLL